jgi:hypothetical protein
MDFNPLNAELNPICHLQALLGAHPILHVSRIRVKTGLCQGYVAAQRHENSAGQEKLRKEMTRKDE